MRGRRRDDSNNYHTGARRVAGMPLLLTRRPAGPPLTLLDLGRCLPPSFGACSNTPGLTVVISESISSGSDQLTAVHAAVSVNGR